MMQKLAKAVSFLFHPLLMPTLGFLLLMNTGFYFALISFEAKRVILLIVVMSTFLLPLISIGLMLFSPRFKLNLDKSSDRIFPMLSTAVFYYLGYYFLGKVPIYPIYRIVLVSSILTIAILLLISTKWKISAHLAGIGGLIGAFLALSFRLNIDSSVLLAALILVAGVVGTARILLGKHNPIQVYAGFFLGFAINYLIINYI
ncbi:phosphatase PAP2 family protein [Mangrovibacterium lignilyticum]|uniref:phosphatase PAP2 family protein n=1 Tax=Mangrovibacterium lignilyticum TaxID=2668052 RepID=UPI0013D22621|nr:phosphatase PAP2 family protein [Mangrovibacterium lignilyticum]